jgi:Ca2+-binding EF-hand superfamily protein
MLDPIVFVHERNSVPDLSHKVSNTLLLKTTIYTNPYFQASFEIFDKNGDGVLSKEEVKKMLVMVVKQVREHSYNANKDNI